MTSARDEILTRLAARADKRQEPRAKAFSSAHDAPAPSAQALLETFTRNAKAAGCIVAEIGDVSDLPDAIRRTFPDDTLKRTFIAGDCPKAVRDATPAWPVTVDAAKADLAITRCTCLVAETGSAVLAAGQPSTPVHNLLADVHIVIAYTAEIVETIEDAWTRAGDGAPSSVVFVTGPSRSADIEQTVEIGVHGARQVGIFILDAM